MSSAAERVIGSRPAALAPILHPASTASAGVSPTGIELSIYHDLGTIATDWREFQNQADCTVFQSYEWLSTWHRHVGLRNGVVPAIVVARRSDRSIVFILPLSLKHNGFTRVLTWLGSDLCDYNAPLLAPDFPGHVAPEGFLTLWRDITHRLRTEFDLAVLEKMPEAIGNQRNPFLQLPVRLNPSGAYLTALAGDWESFYAAKRSSVARRRDRRKRRRLSDLGKLRFVTPTETAEIKHTLHELMKQKARWFARMGVANLFARPGYREFYVEVATHAETRQLVHVSRLDVGSTVAATNLGLMFRGCYYHLLASHTDGEPSRYGPGVAHLHDLLRYATGRGFKRFDFTIGDERYKRDWHDTVVRLHDHVCAISARGWPLAIFLVSLGALKRAIKQNKFAWSAFGKARAALGAFTRIRSEKD